MNLRVKFGRKGPVKYLGHLDMMRYFQKAVMRAELDIKYSEGFNPHQLMSFAYPLGVSMETEGDYMDIEVNSMISCEDITNRLNDVMNEGIYVISTTVVPDGELNAMASVAAASYIVNLNDEILDQAVADYMLLSEIIVTKDGKKGPVTKDIKPGIYELKADGNKLFMKVMSGSTLNIKPQDIINSINDIYNKNYVITSNTRVEIYRDKDGKLVPLGEF